MHGHLNTVVTPNLAESQVLSTQPTDLQSERQAEGNGKFDMEESKQSAAGNVISSQGASKGSQRDLTDGPAPLLSAVRHAKEKDKKSMLSQALSKANIAVELDNAQDYGHARAAYVEACDYLSRVMSRTSNEEDRRKLRAIRSTYLTRVEELQQMTQQHYTLTARSPGETIQHEVYPGGYSRPQVDVSIAKEQPLNNADVLKRADRPMEMGHITPAIHGGRHIADPKQSYINAHPIVDSTTSTSSVVRTENHSSNSFEQDVELLHSDHASNADTDGRSQQLSALDLSSSFRGGRKGNFLLDGVVDDAETDVKGTSSLEAAHNRRYGRRNNDINYREAAQESSGRQVTKDAPEPFIANDDESPIAPDDEDRMLAEITRDFMLDNQTLDDQAKSALRTRTDSEGSWTTFNPDTINIPHDVVHSLGGEHIDKSQSFELRVVPMDHSRTSSTPPSHGSIRTERIDGTESASVGMMGSSVQDRRSPGNKVRKLQIKTANSLRQGNYGPATDRAVDSGDFYGEQSRPSLPSTVALNGYDSRSFNVSQVTLASDTLASGVIPSSSTHSISPNGLEVTRSSDYLSLQPRMHASFVVSGVSNDRGRRHSDPDSPVSLQGFGLRPMSLPESYDIYSPATSGSISIFTSVAASNDQIPGGLALDAEHSSSPFDPWHKNHHPRSIGMVSSNPPSLEPCPQSPLSRPFWLLRCVNETICHPRGGYVTTKLFVPHEVWNMKHVRLKGVDEKIAACQLLIPTLLKLRNIDLGNMDSLLQELQALDLLMDESQASLIRKVGSEVGSQHPPNILKDVSGVEFAASSEKLESTNSLPTIDNPPSGTTFSGSFSKSTGKSSYLSSWRKLRNKTSSTSLTTNLASSRDLPRDIQSSPSVPMVTEHNMDQDSGSGSFSKLPIVGDSGMSSRLNGPNSGYMTAIAQLCSSVQILDDIIQRLENTAIQRSSPTYIGLELSTRHASEFFGFFVCRFILHDLMLMMDKFVNRAAEWAAL